MATRSFHMEYAYPKEMELAKKERRSMGSEV